MGGGYIARKVCVVLADLYRRHYSVSSGSQCGKLCTGWLQFGLNEAINPPLTLASASGSSATTEPPCESIGKMVALGRVELPTNGLGNRCSIHLSYRPYPLFYKIQPNC